MNNSVRNLSAMNPIASKNTGENYDKEVTLCYCKFTPCVVSKKNWNSKKDKGSTMILEMKLMWLAKMHASG